MAMIRDGLLKLLVITMLVDPTNTVLGVKLYLFVLFMAFSATQIKINPIRLMPSYLYYFVILSGTLSLFLLGSPFDRVFLGNYFTTGSTLFLIMALNKNDVNNFIDAFLSGSIIISILTISIFFYFKLTDVNLVWDVDFMDTFIVTPRAFLGIPFLMVYHKSVCALIIAIGVILNRTYRVGFNYKSAILLSLFSFALFASSTRANFLALIAMFGGYFYFLLRRNGYIMLSNLLSFFGLSFMLLLVFLVITYATDNSNSIKQGHILSIVDLLSGNLNYLLFGMGTGSVYYSSGFQEIVPITEVTFFEFVRSFGLIFSPLLFLIYFYPMQYLFRNRHRDNVVFFCSYALFVIVGSTNPLFIGNLGFLILVLAYSVINFEKYEKSTDTVIKL